MLIVLSRIVGLSNESPEIALEQCGIQDYMCARIRRRRLWHA